jgi:hypothetical protein
VAAGLLALGCQKGGDTGVAERLDSIDKRLASIEEKLAKGAGPRGAQRPQRPQRPRPNPNDVYAVPIEGAAWKGAKDAKITVVEAFEFA